MILNKRLKRISLIIILGLFIIIFWVNFNPLNFKPAIETEADLAVAVLYVGDGRGWKDIYSHLNQSLIANMKAYAIDVEKENIEYSLYDVIYLDESIRDASNENELKEDLIQFATKGGGLFIENQLWNFFSSDFIGAKEFVKLNGAPKNIEFPKVRYNLIGLQEVIKDFDYIYKDYIDYKLLDTYDYGYGIKGSGGEVLAEENGIALYTLNKIESRKFYKYLLSNFFLIYTTLVSAVIMFCL